MINEQKKGLKFKKGISLGFLMILLISFIFPVNAVDYHFDEDFSDSAKWTLVGTDWRSGSIVASNSTLSIIDGELVSGGNSDQQNLNGAYINDNTSVGGWSIDIFVPTNTTTHIPTNRVWGLLFSNLKMSNYQNEPNSTKYSEFGVNFLPTHGYLRVYNGTSTQLISKNFNTAMKFDQTQHFDLIRTVDRIYVFIDNEIVLNNSLSPTIGSTINFFNINAAQGSNVTFDNIKITKQANGLLNEILSKSPTSTTSSTSSTPTTTSTTSTTSGFSTISVFMIVVLSIILIRKRKGSD